MEVASLTRYLVPQIRRDLAKKMVFVAGPRQVGKTTLARSLPGGQAGYLNWDVAEHRERILRRELPAPKLWGVRRAPQVPKLAQLPQRIVR